MKRKVEIFSTGCSVCLGVINQVKSLACSSCDVTVLDMKDESVAKRAATLSIKRIPAVVVDGNLLECCKSGGIDIKVLKSAGIGL